VAVGTVINIKQASVKFATDQAGLATAPDFTCQVISAAINSRPNLQTVPATMCAPQSQQPAATGWELALTWLQDWGATPESMSEYMLTNDATLQWFEIAPTDVGVTGLTVPTATGQCWIVAGAYMGAAGTPLTATATCPLTDKPAVTAVSVGAFASVGE
jgi:hypothetical protein